MGNIILTEDIRDIKTMNPGCIIENIIGKQNIDNKTFEFLRVAQPELEFRPIPSLDNKYEVNENGTILRNRQTGYHIKIFLDTHHSKVGYFAAYVNINGVIRRVMLHKVVAECWLGQKPEGLEVDHIDRNPHNNHYTNLRYVTHSEQMKNRILSPRIIDQAKLNCKKYVIEKVMTPVKVIDSDGNILEYESFTKCASEISRVLGCSPEHFRKRVLGKRKIEFRGFTIIYVNEKVKQT